MIREAQVAYSDDTLKMVKGANEDMKINVTSLNYKFNTEGTTEAVTVGLNGYDNENTLSTTLTISDSDVSDKTLDDVTRKELETIAKKKLAELTKVTE